MALEVVLAITMLDDVVVRGVTGLEPSSLMLMDIVLVIDEVTPPRVTVGVVLG